MDCWFDHYYLTVGENEPMDRRGKLFTFNVFFFFV